MTLSEAQAWAVIIGTLASGIVTIITALRVRAMQSQQGTIETKVDTVHELTNSRLSRIEGELLETRAQLVLALQLGARAEQTRVTLAQEAAHLEGASHALPIPEPLSPHEKGPAMTLNTLCWCETCYAQSGQNAQYARIFQANGAWQCQHGETAPLSATTKPPIPADWNPNPHQFP